MMLESVRLNLRRFTLDDVDALLEFANEYERSPVAQFDWKWPTSREGVERAARAFAAHPDFRAIERKEGGEWIGFVNLTPEGEPEAKVFNLGYGLLARWRGFGYAGEASAAILDHAFSVDKAERIVTGTARDNAASCRLLERLGFRCTGEAEGSLRQDEHGQPIVFVGRTYELSRDDWLGRSTDER